PRPPRCRGPGGRRSRGRPPSGAGRREARGAPGSRRNATPAPAQSSIEQLADHLVRIRVQRGRPFYHSRRVDAYSTANWAPVFSAIASASAALTGLLFVALSINLSQVLKGQGLVARAIEVLILLTSSLLVSTLSLMPGQGPQSVAIEILSIATLLVRTIPSIHLPAPPRLLALTRTNFTTPV